MKFISQDSVRKAWTNITQAQKTTKAPLNKFLGLLVALSVLDIKRKEKIKTSYSYQLRNGELSSELQRIFYFGDDNKDFQSTELTFVTFSNDWISNVFDAFLKGSPLSIKDVVAILYQEVPFPDDVSTQSAVQRFMEEFHFDVNNVSFFHSDDTEIMFSDTRINRKALFGELVKLFAPEDSSERTLSMEGTLIKANAGELTRAPFAQTLYSGQESQKCLLFTNFNISRFYNIIPELPLKEEEVERSLVYRNLLLYGAPGTGKSYILEERSKSFGARKKRVTFYPDYSYSKFVGSYKPSTYYKYTGAAYSPSKTHEQAGYPVVNEPVIDYTFVPGPFLQALVEAYKSPEPYVLVIEEINRANAAAVFGEVFQLLDRENGKSVYRVMLSDEAMQYVRSELGERNDLIDNGIYIPNNLYLWATMNSADQGVFHMDAAFKRRWYFEYLPLNQGEAIMAHHTITFCGVTYRWNDFRREINNFLTLNKVLEDRLLGPFFMSADELANEDSVKNKLLVYLRDDVLRHNPRVLFKYGTFNEIIEHYKEGDVFQSALSDRLAEIALLDVEYAEETN
ncbi:AAA family ATPase [Parapedobacter sp. 10938]|uniref:AAA family ATPase n=1 Tax=Parapedobacter flavus TaxID=3110225 RepID=UPI002DBC7786|nr:AAA family ATPase [Parapedobacter sp. 10938]MEC3881922.1 AAA family ATPase [Parapedobacter sp. 10938]